MTQIENNINNYHTNNNMKIKKPTVTIAEAPITLPNHHLFSDKKANQTINSINNDIYEKTQQEKKKSDFNKPLFFKILGIVTLVTIGTTCFSKIKNFFRKS